MTTGERIKQARKRAQMTLKDVSARTGLSIGYLSLVERNQTSLNLVSLKKIASALNISPNAFLNAAPQATGCVIRQDEYRTFRVEGENILYYDLSNTTSSELRFGPLIEVMMPGDSRDKIEPHSHENEEFGYILEGVLTLFLDGKENNLYPGDSFHFPSTIPHALANFTNRVVKILYVVERNSWNFD